MLEGRGRIAGAQDSEPDCLEDGDSREQEGSRKCSGDADTTDSLTKKASGQWDEPDRLILGAGI